MSSRLAASRLSPELRAAIFHFTVFGSTGVASVYFGIWLNTRGVEASEIGIINAAPVLLVLLLNVLVGRLADRASDWRYVIIGLSLIAGIVPIALFFVSGFWGILLVWTLSVMPAFALVPVVDAATLRMTQRRGTDFSAVRAWGTVGFTVTTAVSGPLIAWLGDVAFVPIFVAFALCRAVLSLQLPQFRGGAGEVRKVASAGARRLKDVLRPWFVSALLGLGILYSTHSAIGTFGALLWTKQGIPESMIGPLIATMAASEAVMMFLWKRLDFRISARYLILIAALAAAARWGIMGLSPPIWVLFCLQTLHAVTFAMGYLGGIYFIANWTSEEIAAEAQGFAYVLQQGMAVVSLVGMGWFVGNFGAHAWFALSVYALVGAGFVALSLLLKPASRNPVPPSVAASVPDPDPSAQ